MTATKGSEVTMTELESLKSLLASGEFHHATYRCIGTVWEGLWFYRKGNGPRGFTVAGCVNKTSPDLEAAMELVRHTGVSVGSYGNG
jgi:hypothetical protein